MIAYVRFLRNDKQKHTIVIPGDSSYPCIPHYSTIPWYPSVFLAIPGIPRYSSLFIAIPRIPRIRRYSSLSSLFLAIPRYSSHSSHSLLFLAIPCHHPLFPIHRYSSRFRAFQIV